MPVTSRRRIAADTAGMEQLSISTEAPRRALWQPRQLGDRRSRPRPAANDRRAVMPGSAAEAEAAAYRAGDDFLRRLREAGL